MDNGCKKCNITLLDFILSCFKKMVSLYACLQYLILNLGNFSIFIFYFLSIVGSWRLQVQQRNPNIPLTRDMFQLVLGDPKTFPGQSGFIYLQ